MDVKRLVEYTNSQLECRAQYLFKQRPDVDLAVPINVELLVEDFPNVSIVPKENLIVAHSIEGYVCKEEFLGKQMEIRIDRTILDGNWANYNAVLGEEFAHLELHMALVHAVQSVEDFIALQRDPAWHQYERDAKRFSAAVRMPAALLLTEAERLYPKIVDLHGFGDSARTEKFLCNGLAELFRVPAGEMHRRMMDWPCFISNRIETSVQAGSFALLPLTWSVRAVGPSSQRTLIREQ